MTGKGKYRDRIRKNIVSANGVGEFLRVVLVFHPGSSHVDLDCLYQVFYIFLEFVNSAASEDAYEKYQGNKYRHRHGKNPQKDHMWNLWHGICTYGVFHQPATGRLGS